jgi:iron complex outermembrane receptor protein
MSARHLPLHFTLRACAWAAAMLLAPAAMAQSDEPSATVVVTGSMREQRLLDVPFAITAVDAQALRDAGPMINLSEALARVPGLVVANRSNYAQDLQVSSRGYGARATFGVRGIRIYTDGIPATMPDGQGQVGHMDLAGASRIEVLRGPFSVLYGNASGGVIALFGAPARERQLEAGIDVGSFGLRQGRIGVAAPLDGGFDLKASLSSMELDGFRPQSAARRTLANVRLGWKGERDTVVILANDHSQKADDPLGLPPADFADDPRQTVAVALDDQFDTRKTIRQTQVGVNWRHRFDDGVLRESSLSLYGGSRGVTQYLAIPPLTQRNPAVPNSARHGGGVVDFDRSYDGVEGRLHLGVGAAEFVLGLANERQKDDRRGYENFLGDSAAPTTIGVKGLQRRDEVNSAETLDGFVQGEFALTPSLTATAGVRSGRLDVEVRDKYVVGTNPDDSGKTDFSYTNPVVGLRWAVSPRWMVHASAARGFESPTLGDMAYTLDNSGVNTGLDGQTSEQFELGTKYRSAGFDVDATLFHLRTRDEIGVLTNASGRSVFQNVGRTRRYGLELGGTWRVAKGLQARLVATLLHARYLDDFDTCTGVPCTTASPANHATVSAGNRIAGTQRALGWAELAWAPGGAVPGAFGLEVRGQARTAANDLNSVFAPGFGILSLRWSATWPLGELGELQSLIRVENLADRAYVGSVIVNDGNSRFFEPGAPRNVLGSLRWVKKF